MTRKSGTASDSRQLRAEVEEAREQLAGTVAELAGKADVKAHAREMASHAKSKALFEVNEAKIRMQHGAEEAANRGFTKPGAAVGAVGAIGAAALAVYLVVHRQRAKHEHHWMCLKHWKG
ncbi:DUF3618 domain-containing protein [Streptomyces sp. WMMB 322]|uniref:DUF3618 domain-containing protein n=1 Tax=Streptomyces sp. WMMB 322 TaxID=1286821 RepID=UPI0006E35AA2|nr:DUF3618 domain-containing protein [Streptomyces sp. WMMB 322]SCK43339.1 Protein of unknown function [Streptomyces sp. WMMB 322]